MSIPNDSRLLDVAERLEPPLLLLEDGAGRGPSLLAWGCYEHHRVPWSAAALCGLERFTPGDGWFGVITYDHGLPPKAVRRAPIIAQPIVDLFRPAHRLVVNPDGSVLASTREARAQWRAAAPPSPPSPPSPAVSLGRSFTEESFAAAVRAALEYIRAGDIYQVNISVAERLRVREPALAVYRRLRELNPSPWMGYADFGDWQLVSGSPELLVEARGGRARAKPIAGTRKKTGDRATDAAMRRELVTDAKEAAEHVMLVDLARNDLGRIAEFGTVRVTAFRAVEEYRHVMHLVSEVVATPRRAVRPLDVFAALFPGGTITGCPKIRAMEIIAELEPVARGMYTGALGWWEGGAGQWNILIRGAVVRGGEAVIQAGAGIVADSDPRREWKESLRKATAMREAFGLPAASPPS